MMTSAPDGTAHIQALHLGFIHYHTVGGRGDIKEHKLKAKTGCNQVFLIRALKTVGMHDLEIWVKLPPSGSIKLLFFCLTA